MTQEMAVAIASLTRATRGTEWRKGVPVDIVQAIEQVKQAARKSQR